MKSFDCFNEQHLELDDMLYEEGLRDWFGKSKSKDGKKGWVNVVTGDSCASDKPGEGVPKCVSSEKRASMSKGERKAAQAAKRREDPGQQSKSGAAKPTNVKTDRNVKEEYKDPIHYALKADKELMKLHTKDDKKKKKDVKEACTEYVEEGEAWTKKEGQNKEGGLNEKGRKSYERANPGSDLKAPSKKKGNKRRASFCARMKGMKKKLTSAKTASDPDSRINKSLRAWNCGYEMEGENNLAENDTGRKSNSGHASPVEVGKDFAQNLPTLGTGMIDPGAKGSMFLPPSLMPGKTRPGINLKAKGPKISKG